MAKEEIAVPEETALAEAGGNALDYLTQHAAETHYDPGFMVIKPNKGAKSFDAGVLGTLDGPLETIVMSMNRRRGFWPPDKTISKDQLAVALQCTPDELGKYNEEEVNNWRGRRPLCGSSNNNGTKGELPKILDADAPDIVTRLLEPPMECGFACRDCRWNAFGSDFRGGAGKACKETIALLLYFYDSDMVAILSISPTSIRAWKNYKTSLPGQIFSNIFTEVSTYSHNSGSYEYNLLEFAPVKQKGVIVPVEPEHAKALGTKVTYGGRECMKAEALIAEFLNMELEEEVDSPVNGSVDVEAEDVPFADEGDNF